MSIEPEKRKRKSKTKSRPQGHEPIPNRHPQPDVQFLVPITRPALFGNNRLAVDHWRALTEARVIELKLIGCHDAADRLSAIAKAGDW